MQAHLVRRALLALSLASIHAACVTGGKDAVNLYGGFRSQSGDVTEAEVIPTGAIEGMVGVTGDGISIEGGYAFADDKETTDAGESRIEVDEFYAGVRKTFGTDTTLQPYFAGGVNWMDLDPSGPDGSGSSDDGTGVYVRGGIGFQLGLFQFGFDLRGSLSYAQVEDENASFVQGALFLGLSF